MFHLFETEDEMEHSILVSKDMRVIECSRSTEKGSEVKFSEFKELPKNENTYNLSPTIKLAIELQNNA